jgi:putative oxidoreductase
VRLTAARVIARPTDEEIMLKLSWLLQVCVAIVLLQTLFFKFTGAEESVYIFSTLGVEPWGRYASGGIEVIAIVLLVIPRYASLGALLSLATFSGAILSHLTKLGIEVKGDGGLLFGLAVAGFTSCLAILFIRRREIPALATRWTQENRALQ